MGETTSTTEFSGEYGREAECYRHPGRETNVSCSSCGRPICTDCMVPSPVGMRCPDCGKERTRVVTPSAIGEQSLWQIAPVTVVLMVLNVAVYAYGLIWEASLQPGEALDNDPQFLGGLAGPWIAQGEWYRVITSGFVHGGGLHLLMNMIGLFVLGRLLEPALGRTRFAILYFVSMLAGSLGVIIVDPGSLTVGASGAIFGMLGAAVVAIRARGMSLYDTGVGPILVLNLIVTFAIPGISIGGHVGGLIGGMLVGATIFYLEEGSRVFGGKRWIAPALCCAMGVAFFVATIALAQAKYPGIVNGPF